jgi:hypothetical protein
VMSGLHFVSVTCPGNILLPESLNTRVSVSVSGFVTKVKNHMSARKAKYRNM